MKKIIAIIDCSIPINSRNQKIINSIKSYYPEYEIPANNQFRFEMEENYPELWEVAQRIEGLICGVGSHAGGIIFVDEPFYKTTALMKTVMIIP